MPSYTKEAKKLKCIVQTFGLEIVAEGSHYAIRNDRGKRVGTMGANTSGSADHNIENTVKQLVQNGALPEKVFDELKSAKASPKRKDVDPMTALAKCRIWMAAHGYVEIGHFQDTAGNLFLIYSEEGTHRRMFVTGDRMEWRHGYEYLRDIDQIVKVFDATRDEMMETGRTIASYWRMRRQQKEARERSAR